MRKSFLALAVPISLLIAACGSSYSSPTTAAPSAAANSTPAALATRTVPGLGAVVVDGHGRTLYSFAPDHARKVTCVGGCATVWPPLGWPAGPKPATAGQVQATLVSSAANPSGGRVITYAGWPLYLYVGDTRAGMASGQALNANGGYWYAISPGGKVITAHRGAAAATTQARGGYGY